MDVVVDAWVGERRRWGVRDADYCDDVEVDDGEVGCEGGCGGWDGRERRILGGWFVVLYGFCFCFFCFFGSCIGSL